MRRSFAALLLTLSAASPANAADAPINKSSTLKRTPIPGCGCSLMTPPGFTFEASKKGEGGQIFVGEGEIGDEELGVVVLRFEKRYEFLEGDPDDPRPDMVKAFADTFVEDIGARSNDGALDPRHRWETAIDPGAVGWNLDWDDAPEDGEKNGEVNGEEPPEDVSWYVRASISPTHAALVFHRSVAALPPKWSDSFLNSFRSDLPKPKPTPAPKAGALTRRDTGCGASILAPAAMVMDAPVNDGGGFKTCRGRMKVGARVVGYELFTYGATLSDEDEASLEKSLTGYLRVVREKSFPDYDKHVPEQLFPGIDKDAAILARTIDTEWWRYGTEFVMQVRATGTAKGEAIVYIQHQKASGQYPEAEEYQILKSVKFD